MSTPNNSDSRNSLRTDVQLSDREVLGEAMKGVAKYRTAYRDAAISTRSTMQQLDEGAGTRGFEYMKPFRQQLEDFMDKSRRKELFGKDSLLIGTTPKILQNIGLPKLPLAINQKHVGYAIDGSYDGPENYKPRHTFGFEEFAKLPEKLADPIAIIADPSTKDLVIYVDMVNASGKQTIVPFRLNTGTKLSRRTIDVQMAKTAFGDEDADKVLTSAILKDSPDNIRVYYVNREKVPPTVGLAVRKHRHPVPNGTIHTLDDPRSPVKPPINNITETSQFREWFRNSKVVDRDGSPKVVYHQTAAEFCMFNTDNPRAARYDSETSNGIFFKDNDHDIGLEGKRQMAVYLSIQCPLHFVDRAGRTSGTGRTQKVCRPAKRDAGPAVRHHSRRRRQEQSGFGYPAGDLESQL